MYEVDNKKVIGYLEERGVGGEDVVYVGGMPLSLVFSNLATTHQIGRWVQVGIGNWKHDEGGKVD